jgi:hypothetical protein
MTGQDIKSWLKTTYDRLLALLVLLALLISLLLLAGQAKGLRSGQEKFDHDLQGLRPKHQTASTIGRELFDTAIKAMNAPLQVPAWPLRLMTPEQRVRCVNCERPIPYAVKVCVFCQKEQPESPDKVADKDHDGMLDQWEEQYNLNPLDSDDAKSDADQDGFTNKEEFEFKTHPRDAASHPPALAKVLVEKIKPISFRLIFKGTSRLSGKTVYQVNLRSGAQTWWPSLGEEVEGFKVVEYTEQSPDGPVLTLERGEKRIPLIKGREVPRNEYEVTLRYTGDNSTIVSRVESSFELKGDKYRVIKVDMDAQRVLIRDPLRGIEVWIESQLSSVNTDAKAVKTEN